jgi:hypothetical protein
MAYESRRELIVIVKQEAIGNRPGLFLSLLGLS